MPVPAFLTWLISKFGSKEIEVNNDVRLDFLNPQNSGTQTSNKARQKVVFKIKGDNNVIQINGDVDKQTAQSLLPIREALNSGEISIVTEDAQKSVTDVLAHEHDDPHTAGLLRFFKSKLSTHDYQLLRTGLYIKSYRQKGNIERSSKLWKESVPKTSGRDRRVINLASAGYFETYFRPLYNQLKRDPDATRSFDDIYEEVLEEMPFAIFVSKEQLAGEVIEQVFAKTARNLYFGVSSDIIYIHGTGSRVVKTVDQALEELREKFVHIKVKKETGKGNIIKVAIYYKEHKLSEEELKITNYPKHHTDLY